MYLPCRPAPGSEEGHARGPRREPASVRSASLRSLMASPCALRCGCRSSLERLRARLRARLRCAASHSMKSFVRPYGLVALVGKSSVTGTDAGSPYTVAEEEKTMLLQSPFSIALTRLSVPAMLFS